MSKARQQLVASLINRATGNTVKKLTLPTEAEHISYSAFCTLSATAKRINNYIASLHKKQKKEAKKKKTPIEETPWRFNKARYLDMIKKGVADYLKLTKEEARQLQTGDLDSHISKYKNWEESEKPELTLLGIYEYLFVVVFRYEPKLHLDGKNFAFKVEGQEYYMPAFLKDEMLGKRRNPKLNVQEVTETLIVQDVYNRLKKGVKDTEEKPNGSGGTIQGYEYKAKVDFIKSLKKIAIFCRRKNEELPLDEVDFEEWLDKRHKEISTISMVDALDALFFLSSTTKRYRKTQSTSGFTLAYSRQEE